MLILHSQPHMRVFTAGQKRRVTPAIKRQMRRRSAVEPVIGHIKSEHRMAATISPMRKAMGSTPFWPPPATTSPSAQMAEGVLVALDHSASHPAKTDCRLRSRLFTVD
jgi:hypothetical protein